MPRGKTDVLGWEGEFSLNTLLKLLNCETCISYTQKKIALLLLKKIEK